MYRTVIQEVIKKKLDLYVLIWDCSRDALKQDSERGFIKLPVMWILKEDTYEEAQTISRETHKKLATEVASGTEAGRTGGQGGGD